jgi:hypothetical protein
MTMAQLMALIEVETPDAAPLPAAPRGKISGLDVFKVAR